MLAWMSYPAPTAAPSTPPLADRARQAGARLLAAVRQEVAALDAAKVAALRAHRSQVDLQDGMFAFATQAPEFALEHFQLVRGLRGSAKVGEFGWEDDLFAGLGPG